MKLRGSPDAPEREGEAREKRAQADSRIASVDWTGRSARGLRGSGSIEARAGRFGVELESSKLFRLHTEPAAYLARARRALRIST
jgi:hypothetical protein